MSTLTTKVKNQFVLINILFLILFCIVGMLPTLAMDFPCEEKNSKLQAMLSNESVQAQVLEDFESHSFDAFEVPALGDLGCELRPLRLVPLFSKPYDSLNAGDKQFLAMCHIVSRASSSVRDCFGLKIKKTLDFSNIKYKTYEIENDQEVFNLLREKLAEESVNYLRSVADEELQSAVSTNRKFKSGDLLMSQESTRASVAVLVENMRQQGFSIYLTIKRLSYEPSEDQDNPFIYQGGEIISLLEQSAESQEGDRPAVFIEAYSMKSNGSTHPYQGFLAFLDTTETFQEYSDILLTQRDRLLEELIYPAAVMADEQLKKPIPSQFMADYERAKSYDYKIVPYASKSKRTTESVPFEVVHVHASSFNVEQNKLAAIFPGTRAPISLNTELH